MIPILAAAGAATAEVGAAAAKAAVLTAKTAAEAGAMAAQTGGQVAASMSQTTASVGKSAVTLAPNAINVGQTLATQAAQGGNTAMLEQAVMDLKTGKILPDEILKTDSVLQAMKNTEPVHYNLITRNQALEGDVHPVTGVPFEQKTVIDAEGNKVTGVFAKFESSFDAQLPNDMLKASDKEQFAECNRQLGESVTKDPAVAKKFSGEQLEQIKNGDTPDGYTWHHNEECGKMQLVKSDVHAQTGHTGGRSIWGGGSEFRA